jgi:putative ABC transport system permease protein
MILGEEVLAGVAGAVTGSLLGAVAAPELGALMLKIGVSDPGFTVHIGLWPLVVAALAGIAVVIGSCLVLVVGASVLMSWRSQRTSVLT